MVSREITLDNPPAFAEQLHGQRIVLMDEIGISLGWVINGHLEPEYWKNINTTCFPIMPGGGDAEDRQTAERQLEAVRETHGQGVLFFALKEKGGKNLQWSWGPVLISDLDKSYQELLKELGVIPRYQRHLPSYQMKHRAYQLVRGNQLDHL